MATRRLGRSKVEVTLMGIGTAPLAGLFTPVSDDDARTLIRSGLDEGLRYVDTAPFYGYGLAERRVGDALRAETPGSFTLSTKAGRLLRPQTAPRAGDDQWASPLGFEAVFDYSYDAVMRSFEDSLQRLGLARIDVLYLHDLGIDSHAPATHRGHVETAWRDGVKAMRRLRDEGSVGAIGLGVNVRDILIEAMDHADWDAFLLAGRYTLLEQEPLDDLLPRCEKVGTSIVVGGPYNSGILAGGETWNYAAAPPEVIEKAMRLDAVCKRHGVPLMAAALQFPLAHPTVASVIPGARSPAEMATNLAMMRTEIPIDLWTELQGEGLIRPDAPVPGPATGG